MAEDAVKVQAEGLATLSAELLRSARRIDAILGELDRKLIVLNRQWSGSASTEYHAAQARWQRAMTELREELAASADDVAAMQDNYARATQIVAEIWAEAI